MAGFVQDTFADLDEEQKKEVEKIAAALSAEAQLPSQREQDKQDAKIIEEGRTLMIDTYSCITCHTFRGRGAKTGPDLTGYGSKPWLVGIISDPQGKAYYPKTNDGMPSYLNFPDQPGRNLLAPEQVEAIAEMIRSQE
jgi:ubiquinol-cytochrome c reductase cytochrome b subunit